MQASSPQAKGHRQEVVIYHSAYGLRPAVIDFANNLRAHCHTSWSTPAFQMAVLVRSCWRQRALERKAQFSYTPPLMVRDLGWTVWPSNVPVQVHFADKDPIRNQAVIDALSVKVRQSGSNFEQFDYDAPGTCSPIRHSRLTTPRQPS